MDKNDVFLPRPINTVLEGNKNYLSWSQAIHSFLKDHMLWHFCTGTITILFKGANEEDDAFLVLMIEWDSHNHMISHGFGTLPFPPSPICWVALMMQNQHGICWPKGIPLLTDP